MSVLPTLMIRGKLVSPTGDPALQPPLDSWIPYEYILEWFRARKDSVGIENRALILKSETASGKSTLLPPKIFEAFVLGGKGAGVICTQPRIYTAKDNVLQMIANYKFLRLGDNVGWSTGEDKVRPRAMGLLSATIGTLTQQLKTLSDDEIMRKYKFILIDETHERDLQTDMTIYMLKSLLQRQRANIACPFVVLMSATFEPDSFLKYFGIEKVSNFIWCRGEAAGFDEIWDWNAGRIVNNYPQAAATVIEKIIREGTDDAPERGDIFVFLPGAAEFRETTKYLDELNKKLVGKRGGCPVTGAPECKCAMREGSDSKDRDTSSDDSKSDSKSGGSGARIEGTDVFSILPIESTAVKGNTQAMRWITTPLQDQSVVIGGKNYVPARRVILTTNVAETGVTVPSIKYVIDAGFNRGVEYNPALGVTALLTAPAPQSRIRQRKGRAGRKFRGVFYPLYPQYIYDKLPVNQLPQILTSDITPIILDIVFEQLRAKMAAGDRRPTFRLADIDMVDVPAQDALAAAVEKLFAIGFLRYEPADWPGPTLEDAKKVSDPSMPPAGTVKTNSIDNNPVVRTIGFTRFGAIAAFIAGPSLGPEAIRAIFAAYSWGVDIAEMITICAWIELDPQKALAKTVDGKRVTIDWSAIYKEALPMGAGPLRTITLDEFIDGVILITAVKSVVRADEPLGKLQEWCDKVGVDSEFIVKFITARDELIDHFISNGFLINNRAPKLAEATTDYMEVVTRIKHCIYDGWRCGMVVLGESGYKSSTGVSVVAPKFLADRYKNVEMRGKIKPKYIIVKNIGVKYNRDADIYEAVPGLASVMDGFVAVDLDYST